MPLSLALITTGIFVTSFPIVLLTVLLVLGIYEGTILLAVACLLLLFNRIIVMSKSKQSIAGALLYPIGTIILLLDIFNSMFRYEMKKPRWEKRKSI